MAQNSRGEISLIPIGKSVSTELFRRVFICYILVAIVITSFQLFAEFDSTRDNIKTELESISNSIAPGLESALWNIDHLQLVAIVEGTFKLPVIIGVTIENEDGDVVQNISADVIDNINSKVDDMGSIGTLSNTYLVNKPLYFIENNTQVRVGRLQLYSSPNVVFQRVKLGFVLILINSIIKSIALWLLFIVFSRIIISRPMAELTGLVKSISANNILIMNNESFKAAEGNELSVLKKAFDTMLQELSLNQEQLRAHALELEDKVAERTKTLAVSEAKLRLAHNELETTRKSELAIFESKTQFMVDISHELRTPLSVLRVQLEAMQAGIVDEEESYEVLQRRLSQLERIINDVSIISQADINQLILQYKTFDAFQFFHEIIDSYKALTKQRALTLSCNLVAIDSLLIRADWERLSQVFSNLLNNSLRYTNQGGVIHIAAQIENSQLVVHIEDSAPGVSEKDIHYLFDRLFRVESSRSRDAGGSGLGLAICKTIVQGHGGKIMLYHSDLGGIKVSVVLPVIHLSASEAVSNVIGVTS